MPEMDEGAFILDYFMPAGTSLAETDRVLQRVDKILCDTPDVAGYHPPHRGRERACSPPSPSAATSW